MTATPRSRANAPIDSGLPVIPVNDGSKCATYRASAAGVSRAGSTVASTTSGISSGGRSASWRRASASVASVVGQTSGQFVKPKKSRVQWPRIRARSKACPDWSCSAIAGSGRDASNSVARSSAGTAGSVRVRKKAVATPARAPADDYGGKGCAVHRCRELSHIVLGESQGAG